MKIKENMEKNIVTTIDGTGIIEVKNDIANFTLSIRSKNDSLETAKKQVEEKTTQFFKEFKSLEEAGMKIDGEVSTSMSNYKLEHREGSERYAAGFQSVNTISWSVIVDDKIDNIFKTCLKTDATMSYPFFSIKNRDELLKQALQNAAEDVKEKLNMECSLLGINPKDLKILNWNFGYDGHLSPKAQAQYYGGVQGATGPQGMQGSPGTSGVNYNAVMKLGSIYQELLDTKLMPGTLSVKAAVRVNYIWNVS